MNINNKIKALLGVVVVAGALGFGSTAFAGPYCVTPAGAYYLYPMPAGSSCYVNIGGFIYYGYANW
jgi:hypothetical protein